ncbi:MAG: lactonase family protein [Tannerellaceae bacterium]|jgi:6-phosphogluconolactonase (cycloisomerase 2 family)|nr:lactonase family protein [Tannerellaceae bacterium]
MNSILYLLIGTYTFGLSEGIYIYKFNTDTGVSAYVNTVEVEHPSYMDITTDGKFVYSVTENDEIHSLANAFSFDKEQGKLTLLNSEKTHSAAPCNILIDSDRKHIVTANYGGGSITVFPVDSEGKLSAVSQMILFEGSGKDTVRQEMPHLHCVKFTPDGNYLLAADLGTDQIHRLTLNPSDSALFLNESSLKSFKVADGSGPRHFVFHPNNKYMYLINEIGGTVTGFNYKDGELEEFQTIQADTLHAKGSGDIGITPNGKFLYASNRLQGDGIAIFSINEADGKLTKTGYQPTGIHPRNFVITPNGKFLLSASRDNSTVEVFEIDENTGFLKNIDKNIEVDTPVCLKFIN